MSDIKINQNITVTIKGQTFVLSSEEAKDLLHKLKSIGVSDYVPTYPIHPWSAPVTPNNPPYPLLHDIWYSNVSANK